MYIKLSGRSNIYLTKFHVDDWKNNIYCYLILLKIVGLSFEMELKINYWNNSNNNLSKILIN